MVDFAWSYSCIAEVFWVAVRGVEAAAGRNAVGWVIHTGKPTGVVIHSTTTQLEMHRESIKNKCGLKDKYSDSWDIEPL